MPIRPSPARRPRLVLAAAVLIGLASGVAAQEVDCTTTTPDSYTSQVLAKYGLQFRSQVEERVAQLGGNSAPYDLRVALAVMSERDLTVRLETARAALPELQMALDRLQTLPGLGVDPTATGLADAMACLTTAKTRIETVVADTEEAVANAKTAIKDLWSLTCGLGPAEAAAVPGAVMRLTGSQWADSTDPKWTVGGGAIGLDGGHYSGEYTWSQPPGSIGPQGFQITLSVTSSADKGQRHATGINMTGNFDFDPTPPSVEIMAEGDRRRKSQVYTVKPRASYASGDEVRLTIGAFYGPSVTYTYKAD
jgi:hypothetical protein